MNSRQSASLPISESPTKQDQLSKDSGFPPGPRGLPVLGLGPQMIRDSLGLIQRLQQNWGDIVSMPLPGIKGVLTCDPDLIQLVFLQSEKKFHKSKLYERMAKVFGQGLVTSSGDTWKSARKAMNPLFFQKAVLRYQDVVRSVTREFMSALPSPGAKQPEILLKKSMTDIAFKVLLKSIFPECQSSLAIQFQKDFQILQDYSLGLMWNLWTPPLGVPTPGNIRYLGAKKRMESIIDAEIKKRNSGQFADNHDFICLLMDMKKSDPKLTNQDIRDHVLTMFFAGHDTTANSMTFMFYLLSKHPEVTDNLRKYYQTSDDDGLSVAQKGQPDYPEQVINETLRLYPPAWMVNRICSENFHYKHYIFKAGTTFFLPQYLVHRHHDHWEKPDEFYPDHFSDDLVKKRHKFAFFPFGGGPRNCIGLHFSMLEMKIVMKEVLLQLEPVLTELSDPELSTSITMSTKEDIPMYFQRL